MATCVCGVELLFLVKIEGIYISFLLILLNRIEKTLNTLNNKTKLIKSTDTCGYDTKAFLYSELFYNCLLTWNCALVDWLYHRKIAYCDKEKIPPVHKPKGNITLVWFSGYLKYRKYI